MNVLELLQIVFQQQYAAWSARVLNYDLNPWPLPSLQVSDDEDDTHPNIDTPSLFRWRHQARVERMEESKKEKEQFEARNIEHKKKVKELTEKLKASDVNAVSMNNLILTKSTLSFDHLLWSSSGYNDICEYLI